MYSHIFMKQLECCLYRGFDYR